MFFLLQELLTLNGPKNYLQQQQPLIHRYIKYAQQKKIVMTTAQRSWLCGVKYLSVVYQTKST